MKRIPLFDVVTCEGREDDETFGRILDDLDVISQNPLTPSQTCHAIQLLWIVVDLLEQQGLTRDQIYALDRYKLQEVYVGEF